MIFHITTKHYYNHMNNPFLTPSCSSPVRSSSVLIETREMSNGLGGVAHRERMMPTVKSKTPFVPDYNQTS